MQPLCPNHPFFREAFIVLLPIDFSSNKSILASIFINCSNLSLSFMPASKKQNIILFVGQVFDHMIHAIRAYEKKRGVSFRIGLLYDPKLPNKTEFEIVAPLLDVIIRCDTHSMIDLQKNLLPYQDELLAITCRAENQIQMLTRVIPHVPYLRTPLPESLVWASDKLSMRRRLYTYDKNISPRYTLVQDVSKKTIDKVKTKIGFPLIIKPSGLAASRLVTICYHEDELKKNLQRVFRHINRVHKETIGNWEPKVLVEQFLDGEMYSVDAYVTARGKIYFCPLVHVKTGKQIGFDDFFGYRQITPTNLSTESKKQAENVATDGVYALGLRNTTAHIEMMRTEQGWKVIEIGARIGGFRHMMYDFSYGINHTMNDILVRIGEKPVIPKKIKGYTAAMKFFAQKEGTLSKLKGIKKIQELSSFKQIDVNKKLGDSCTFAKNGGTSVFNIILFNKHRSDLLADIRRIEQSISIETV